jgi:hypothetical protein
MIDPELERKFKEIRAQKKKMLHDFTRKAVDAINVSEQVSQTFMSICDSNCAMGVKSEKKLKKKDETDADEATADEEDSSEDSDSTDS